MKENACSAFTQQVPDKTKCHHFGPNAVDHFCGKYLLYLA